MLLVNATGVFQVLSGMNGTMTQCLACFGLTCATQPELFEGLAINLWILNLLTITWNICYSCNLGFCNMVYNNYATGQSKSRKVPASVIGAVQIG